MILLKELPAKLFEPKHTVDGRNPAPVEGTVVYPIYKV